MHCILWRRLGVLVLQLLLPLLLEQGKQLVHHRLCGWLVGGGGRQLLCSFCQGSGSGAAAATMLLLLLLLLYQMWMTASLCNFNCSIASPQRGWPAVGVGWLVNKGLFRPPCGTLSQEEIPRSHLQNLQQRGGGRRAR